MLGASLDLYATTRHLPLKDRKIWEAFIDDVREHEDEASYFRYEDLEDITGA